MKTNQIFQIALYLSLLTFPLTGCSQFQHNPRPTFQSDGKLVENFEENKAELLSLIQECEAEYDLKGFKADIRESFIDCDFSESVLGPLNVKEVAVEFKESVRPPTSFNDVGGKKVLFVTDYYKDDSMDAFVEEKGYTYSPVPLRKDVIGGSLDQFSGEALVETRVLQEAWRYKQIEPNWYLYYRQYYYPFLG